MTAGLSSTVANGLLNALCRAVNYTAPVAFYVKLHTGDPGAAGTANAAGNTTRKSTSFAAASGGAVVTNGSQAWTSVSTTETYSYISFWDAVTSGNFLGSCQLAAPRSVTAGDNFTLPSGDGSLTLLPIAA